jgi:hypothetical protein
LFREVFLVLPPFKTPMLETCPGVPPILHMAEADSGILGKEQVPSLQFEYPKVKL